MNLGNKYELGQLVFYANAPYWITAIIAKPGYEGIDWEYNLTKPAYSDATKEGVKYLGGRMDVKTFYNVREYNIETVESNKVKRLKEIEEQRKELEKEMAELLAQKELIENA